MINLILKMIFKKILKNRRRIFSIVFMIIVIIFIKLLISFYLNDKIARESISIADYNMKYIAYNLNTSNTLNTPCGGLGNMIFRIVSLYTIGLRLNRKIYFIPEECIIKYKEEMAELFHHLHLQINFIVPNPDEYKLIEFANNCCCCFSDPESLLNETATFLQLRGNYFQSYKYYKGGYKAKIRKLLTFKTEYKESASLIAQQLFKNDTNHKFCVHIRRGEFYAYTPFYSTKRRTELMIYFVLQVLKKKHQSISLILLGKDKNFLNALNIDKMLANNTYMLEDTKQSRRNDEFVFAIEYCDSLLKTAPSTYAWWIGYLMREDSPIFFDKCPSCTHINHRDYFPYEWIPLTFLHGEVQIADTWDGSER